MVDSGDGGGTGQTRRSYVTRFGPPESLSTTTGSVASVGRGT